MTGTICICRYPLHIIDKRNGETVEYFAVPNVTIDEMDGELPVPNIEFVKRPDLNKSPAKDYVKVSWVKDSKSPKTKEYEIIPHGGVDSDSHIVVAGCNNPNSSKCKLSDKTIFAVYHPLREWKKQHKVTIGR